MKKINQTISQSISCLLAISLLFISSISYADDALVLPKESQWKFLTESTTGKFNSMLYYSIAPRSKNYPPNWAQVWVKEELLECTQITCGYISRQRLDCSQNPKGFVQEQIYGYDINGKRNFTNSGQQEFVNITGDEPLIKLFNKVCTETSNERRFADERQQKEQKKAEAAKEKRNPTLKPTGYEVTLPLTSEPDGTGFVYSNEAYILFENGVQVGKGVTDRKGDISYPLKKNANYIIQFSYGKYSLNPERRKTSVNSSKKSKTNKK